MLESAKVNKVDMQVTKSKKKQGGRQTEGVGVRRLSHNRGSLVAQYRMQQ
jgi:hypothetical protein